MSGERKGLRASDIPNMIEQYNSGISLNKLSKLFKAGAGTLRSILIRNGITIRGIKEARKFHTLEDSTAHYIPNKEKIAEETAIIRRRNRLLKYDKPGPHYEPESGIRCIPTPTSPRKNLTGR